MKKARTILWLLTFALFCSNAYPVTMPPLPQLPTQEAMHKQFESLKKKFNEQVDRFKTCVHEKNCSRIAIPAITLTALLLLTLLGRLYVTKRKVARERAEAERIQLEQAQAEADLYKPQSDYLRQEITDRYTLINNLIAIPQYSAKGKENLQQDLEEYAPVYNAAFQEGISWQDHVTKLQEALNILNRHK